MAVQAWLQSIREMPPARRRLLLGGWALVLCLMAYLAAKPMFHAWQEARQWRDLAQQARAIGPTQSLSAERLQSLASARHIVLTRLEAVDGQWHLQGEVDQPQAIQQLMRGVQEQGAVVQQWRVERQGQRLSFNLLVAVRP